MTVQSDSLQSAAREVQQGNDELIHAVVSALTGGNVAVQIGNNSYVKVVFRAVVRVGTMSLAQDYQSSLSLLCKAL